MKKVFILMIAGGIMLTQACNSSESTDSVEQAKDANDTTVSNDDSAAKMAVAPVDKDDADFAVEAANGSMTEVEMGKLAQTKATNPRVKAFADMMVTDHTKAGEDLKAIAAAKSITLPVTISEDAQKEIADLGKKSGKDFDKAYMDMMLDDHKKDVDKFKDASEKCKDTEIRNFASMTLPALQTHLDSAKAITNKK